MSDAYSDYQNLVEDRNQLLEHNEQLRARVSELDERLDAWRRFSNGDIDQLLLDIQNGIEAPGHVSMANSALRRMASLRGDSGAAALAKREAVAHRSIYEARLADLVRRMSLYPRRASEELSSETMRSMCADAIKIYDEDMLAASRQAAKEEGR